VRKHWRLVWRIGPYLRPHRALAGGSLAVMVLSVLVALAEPWPLAFLIDGVLGGEDGEGHRLPTLVTDLFGTDPKHLVFVGVIAGLGLAIVINGLSLLNEYFNTKLSQNMITAFRADLVENALKQSVAFHDARSMGDFIARINYESASVGTITVSLPPLIESVLTLCGMAFIAYRIDHQLALAALVVVPFVYYSTGYYGKHIEPKIRHARGLEGRSLNIVYEAMSMLRVISLFNRGSHEHRRFHEQARTATDARVRVTLRQSLFSFAVNIITAFGTALVLGLGALHVLDGRLSIGEVLVLLSYVHSVYGPLQAISHSMASFQEQFIYLDMSLELLDQVPDVRDLPGALPLPPVEGAVVFDHVDFAYAGREHTLVDVCFAVAPGEAVAVVGPTGAGKTTLMSLLSRLAQPLSGRITVDGTDISTVTIGSLREQISVVPQEPALFTGTVGDNIRYGRLDATDDEVEEATKAANAHDFVMRLPKQYDTLLGENGTALSGGEKQRLCLARAFLKDAPILILDEPTSSIDSKTEAVILDAIERLMAGRTTFMIAHRLSTLRSVDRILVLDQGRLVEEGAHHELMDRGGLYKSLHEVQATQRARLEPADAVSARPIAAVPADGRRPVGRRTRLLATVLAHLDGRLRQRSYPYLQPVEAPAAAESVSLPPVHHGPAVRRGTIGVVPNPATPIEDAGGAAVVDVSWTVAGVARCQIRIDAPDGPLFAETDQDPDGATEHVRSTGPWVADGMTFFLQDASADGADRDEQTLASVVVHVPAPDPGPGAEDPPEARSAPTPPNETVAYDLRGVPCP
jgi:ATP-binding cassette subfamily B protein